MAIVIVRTLFLLSLVIIFRQKTSQVNRVSLANVKMSQRRIRDVMQGSKVMHAEGFQAHQAEKSRRDLQDWLAAISQLAFMNLIGRDPRTRHSSLILRALIGSLSTAAAAV